MSKTIQYSVSASPVLLDRIAKRKRMAALSHPNATPEQLIRWLSPQCEKGLEERIHALENNPSFSLLLLEDLSPSAPFLSAYWKAQYFRQHFRLHSVLMHHAVDDVLSWMERIEEQYKQEPDLKTRGVVRFADQIHKEVHYRSSQQLAARREAVAVVALQWAHRVFAQYKSQPAGTWLWWKECALFYEEISSLL